MAEAAAEPPAGGEGGGKKAGMMVVLIFAGALLGGLAAAIVVAPRLIRSKAPPAGTTAPGDSAGAGHEGGGEEHAAGGEGGEGGEEVKLVELTNIIVNPAGSQGSRFLMTTVALSVPTPEAEALLRKREVELKDKVTSILESQTMAQLTAAGARDSMKVKIAAAVVQLLGLKVPVRVFLPQFVIQ